MLPSGAPAILELLDISGRQVVARQVGSPGAGDHLLRIDGGSSLAAGMYWLRLTKQGRTALARGAIVR